MSTEMEEFFESPILLLQCGIAIAVPTVLTAIINFGCGKNRERIPRLDQERRHNNNFSNTTPRATSSTMSTVRSERSINSRKKRVAGASSRDGKSQRSTKSGKKRTADVNSKEGKSERSSKVSHFL
uniref:Uncharacterized protein n=1 Tax=Panagrolaimus davidi TaxID=227884 RepID=A0A914Q4F1_9BILA